MKETFYSMPVPLGKLLKKEQLPVCKIEDSIKQNILLILMTHFEEYGFDPTFGCRMWEQDFELLPSPNIWKEELKRSIYESIQKYEPRLSNLKLTVKIDELPFTHPEDKKVLRIKKRLGIKMEANLTDTNEDFVHTETLFLSPISLD